MQSVVIVLLKVILSTITTSLAQSSANGSQYGTQFQDTNASNNVESIDESLEKDQFHPNAQDLPIEMVEVLRSQEITVKSISGILILLLKWFKLSRK